MTMSRVGEDFRPLDWLSDGWAALRDKTHAALTYFHPEEGAKEETGGRWGLVATDVVDHDAYVELRMEIPGVQRDELNVEIRPGRIVVSGEKRRAASHKHGNLVVTERAFGSFRRAMPLPTAVDARRTEADYADGVLTIRLPKREDGDAARRIAIH